MRAIQVRARVSGRAAQGDPLHTHTHSLSLTLSENVQQSASARNYRWPVLVRACVSERVPYRVIACLVACLYPPLLLCSSRAPARTIVPKETTTNNKYKQQQQAKPQSVIHTNTHIYMCAYEYNCRIVYKFVLYLFCFFFLCFHCFHCFCHFIFNCSR